MTNFFPLIQKLLWASCYPLCSEISQWLLRCESLSFMCSVYGGPLNQKTHISHFEKLYCFFYYFLPFIFCVLMFLSLLLSVFFFLTFLPYFLRFPQLCLPTNLLIFFFILATINLISEHPFLFSDHSVFKHTISWMRYLLISLINVGLFVCLVGFNYFSAP